MGGWRVGGGVGVIMTRRTGTIEKPLTLSKSAFRPIRRRESASHAEHPGPLDWDTALVCLFHDERLAAEHCVTENANVVVPLQ